MAVAITVAGCASVPDGSDDSPDSFQARCVEGVPEPSISDQLRPTPRLLCDYSPTELNRRIVDLLRIPPRSLSIESVERTLGLPPIHTAFDATRSADYAAIVEATDGSGSWRIYVSFSETFFPPISGRPDRFRGSMRPVLIDGRYRGDIRLQIDWLQPNRIDSSSPACLAVDDMVEQARRFGWRHRPNEFTMSSHAGMFKSVLLTRGRAEASTDVTGGQACLDELLIARETDLAEPPVTEEELRRDD